MSETKSNASKIEEGRGKAQEPLTNLGFKQEKSAAVGPVLILKTGKQVELLSFSHKGKPISGIC